MRPIRTKEKVGIILLLVALLLPSLQGLTWAGDEASARPQGSQPGRPVIFVHGYCGSDTSWQEEDTIYSRLLQSPYHYDPGRLILFRYPEDLFGQEDNRGDIARVAETFGEAVEKARRASPDGRVDVVAHSMGVLVVRYYMAYLMPDKQNPTIGRLIAIAGPNEGSFLADVKVGEMLCLAGVCPIPLKALMVALALLYTCSEFLRWRACCFLDPHDTAVTQMVPGGRFLSDLNRPGNSSPNVYYYVIYGNIRGWIQFALFKWKTRMEISIGDTVVGVESATTIPGIGRLGETTDHYRAFEYLSEHSVPMPVHLRKDCPFLGFRGPFCFEIEWNLLEKPTPHSIKEVQHGGLIHSEDVTRLVDRILRGEFEQVPPTPEPSLPPPLSPPPGTGGATATVLVLDVSGSMGEAWQGGVKIESAREAGIRLVRRVQHENEVAGPIHRMAMVNFTTDAWVSAPLGSDLQVLLDALENAVPLDRTNIGQALELANAELSRAAAQEGRYIILLTDGMTNVGLSKAEILSGPVAEAARAGTCIYTVGFGDPGNLDEQFLRDIAAAAPCGEYAYAPDADRLAEIYVRLRHVTTGRLLAEHEGTIAQGQRLDLGTFEVPAGQGELHVTLDWPGSTLDLLLTDPRGRTVDETYPGGRIFREATSVYVLIQNPPAGRWQVGVLGKEIPQGSTTFYLAASTRGVAPPSASAMPVWMILCFVLVIGAGLVIAVAVRGPAPAGAVAALYGVAGPVGQAVFPLQAGTYTLGRDPSNALVLSDALVSGRHAQITSSGNAFFLADLGSTNGTYVNRFPLTPFQWYMLQEGDQIQMGNCILAFRYGKP
ncbi:MAG: FHA domain-containing protein [Chloroflexia bacterium]